jgi:hypothetical protein
VGSDASLRFAGVIPSLNGQSLQCSMVQYLSSERLPPLHSRQFSLIALTRVPLGILVRLGVEFLSIFSYHLGSVISSSRK